MTISVEINGDDYTVAVAGGESLLLAAILEEQKKQTIVLLELLEAQTGQKKEIKRKGNKK